MADHASSQGLARLSVDLSKVNMSMPDFINKGRRNLSKALINKEHKEEFLVFFDCLLSGFRGQEIFILNMSNHLFRENSVLNGFKKSFSFLALRFRVLEFKSRSLELRKFLSQFRDNLVLDIRD